MNSPFEPPTGDPVWPATASTGDGGRDRRRRNRRNTTLGVSAGLLGGGAVGLLMMMPSFSSAASTETPDSTVAAVDDSSTADTSTATDVDSDTTDETAPADTPDATSRVREALQPLVDDGTITSEQADAVAATLAEEFPRRGGPGGGFGHRGGHPGFDGEVLAGLLGIDVETLRSELADGSTVAEIAADHGVEVQTVIDALVAEATTHLDQAVTDGRLTQEEADSKLADLTERITDRINNGHFEGRGRGSRGGDDDETPADDSSTDSSVTADTGS